jgi:CspA family cold shock protein
MKYIKGVLGGRRQECGMDTGVVKWFNSAKGYGFVTPDDGGRDLFVHYTDIQSEGYRNLQQGQRVHYEFCDGEKGPHAGKVTIPETAGNTTKEEEEVVEAT